MERQAGKAKEPEVIPKVGSRGGICCPCWFQI